MRNGLHTNDGSTIWIKSSRGVTGPTFARHTLAFSCISFRGAAVGRAVNVSCDSNTPVGREEYLASHIRKWLKVSQT